VRFEVTVQQISDGDYIASCEDPQCTGHGLSPANALDSVREEIRYRMELCPCTTVDDSFVEIDVVSAL
jgi:hypothetical protein